MKTFGLSMLILGLLLPRTTAAAPPLSDETEGCLECHETLHPGIVADWRRSRHARTTPAQAMTASALARRVSAETVPNNLQSTAVGCAECHTLRPAEHADTFEHNDVRVHVVVSPRDCAVCHPEEAEQFSGNLMALAHRNLTANPVYGLLKAAITRSSHPLTDADACLYCHGTRLVLEGRQTRETEYGELEFPVIAGWPNQGTGRVNLDGSRGACSACHTRHRFSIAMARKPYTCKECHVGPDVPAFKVYTTSKHGNLFSANQHEWRFDEVPWTAGKDFGAPTCAVCHISLVVNTGGDVLAARSHDVKSRLPYRIFGLPYAHPHPRDPDTTLIRNASGLPLPTDWDGRPADGYLLDAAQRAEARRNMQGPCLACHDRSWVDGHWKRFEHVLGETDDAVRAATEKVRAAWADGRASGPEKGANPFDEWIERLWSDGWLFYANSIRFASAMAGGGDYGVFAQGRYHMSRNRAALGQAEAAARTP